MTAHVPPAEIDRQVIAYRAGDPAAFETLIRETEDELRCFVIANCIHIDVVDEAVQRAYITAFEAIDRYELRGCFIGWVKGIARNHLHDLARERRRLRHDDLDQVTDSIWAEATESHQEDWWRRSLVDLQSCLETMHPVAKAILLLHHGSELTLNALAQRYRRKRDVLVRQLFVWRQQLRACVQQRGVARDA